MKTLLNTFIISDDLQIVADLKKYSELNVICSQDFSNVSISKIVGTEINLLILVVNETHSLFFKSFDLMKNRTFEIVFLSNTDKHMMDAINLNSYGYLVTPINYSLLYNLICKIKNQSNHYITNSKKNVTDSFSIKTNRGFEFIRFNEILRFEAAGSYSKLFTCKGKSHIISKNLREIEDEINSTLFFRTHKSNLINIMHVKFIGNCKINHIIMIDDSITKLAKSKRDSFFKLINPKLKTNLIV